MLAGKGSSFAFKQRTAVQSGECFSVGAMVDHSHGEGGSYTFISCTEPSQHHPCSQERFPVVCREGRADALRPYVFFYFGIPEHHCKGAQNLTWILHARKCSFWMYFGIFLKVKGHFWLYPFYFLFCLRTPLSCFRY